MNALQRRWLSAGLRALRLLAVVALVFLLAWRYESLLLGILGLLLLGGAAQRVGRLQARVHGKRVERAAQASLKLPEGWEQRDNVRQARGGDVDIVVVSPVGERFCIELKSQEKVRYVTRFWRRQEGFKVGNRWLAPNPADQACHQARRLSGKPVLWFPRARHRQILTTRTGCLVVFGPARTLRRALGATPWWWPF